LASTAMLFSTGSNEIQQLRWKSSPGCATAEIG
jgi:hypothetical protein